MIDENELTQLFESVRRRLLDARTPEGVWNGRLSSSPLATALAVFALHAVDGAANHALIAEGLNWLVENQHADGGWGDAEQLDPPNLSSTLLCYAALRAIAADGFSATNATTKQSLAVPPSTLQKAEAWIQSRAGSLEPQRLAQAVYESYGEDRTFAVPILTMGALAGILGNDGWRFVKALPFELALLPRAFFRWLKLTVVSYALPALIAIGQAKHHFDPPRNLLIRILRRLAVNRSLRLLERIQPSNGGFLEAVPLTSFVVMSLACAGNKEHGVVQKGVEFLRASRRSDGSWPIDTNLSVWCTSLAVNALLKQTPEALPSTWRKQVVDWYVAHQFKQVHPYTGAAPGGWGWTHLPGAVPDADDTAGALIALHRLGIQNTAVLNAVKQGLIWLLDLQNADGGIPTFCRGWGRLEFDRSCPDITAHTIQAWQLWSTHFDTKLQQRLSRAISIGLKYLESSQTPEGSWQPLWFGNPFLSDHANPVYGTARVLQGIESVKELCPGWVEPAVSFLLRSRNDDGGWGSQKGASSSLEETCITIDALCPFSETDASKFINEAMTWVYSRSNNGFKLEAAPVGLYFSKLWYAEALYPMIWLYSAIELGFRTKKSHCVRKMVK